MLRNTSVRTTALLAALLLAAGAAQATMLDAREMVNDLADSDIWTSGDDREDSGDESPEQGPGSDPEGAGTPDLMGTTRQAQERAVTTVEEAEQTADIDMVLATIEDGIAPIQQAVDDAQAQADGLLYGDKAPEYTAPSESTTATTASVGAFPILETPVLLLASAALSLGFLLWFAGQSATLGAGAAGTAALRDGRRFIPFASPMFTRFEKDTVLGHPKREAIYGSIISTPGITLQDLCEETGLSRTAVTHHLRLMEQQHLIVSKRVGRSRHFFENGGRYGRHQKDAYAVLHNERTKEIHDHIQGNPGAIQKDICAAFDIQPSVAHWHLKRLTDANLVDSMRQGRTVSYFPAEALTPSAAEVAEATPVTAAPVPLFAPV